MNMFTFKKRFSASLLVFILLLTSSPLSAATNFSLYPLKISVTEGQTFRLAVNVNPNGQKNYTVKVGLNFPADLVSVSSWSFSGSWQPLSQPGYDSIDNSSGNLIKTAGYPSGINKAVTFGTVTFKAKKTGTGTISFTGGSMALDEENANQYNGGNQVPLTIEKIVEKKIITKPELIVKPETLITPKPATPDLTVNAPLINESVSPSELNPPIGQQPEIITIATNTSEIISPEEIRKINNNLDNLNLNLVNIVQILLIIALFLLVLIILVLIVLLIYIFRKRGHRTRVIISEGGDQQSSLMINDSEVKDDKNNKIIAAEKNKDVKRKTATPKIIKDKEGIKKDIKKGTKKK